MSEVRRTQDHFERLGEPRRPWLDSEALKTRFVESSTVLHPDRYHGADAGTKAAAGDRYSELNTAYQVLSETRARLLYLLELEAGAKPQDIQRIPPGTMDLFIEVGQLCRDVDTFLDRRNQVTSPMLKVRLFTEGIGWVEKLKALQAKISGKEEALKEELRAMNAIWETAPPMGDDGRVQALPLARLEEVYRVFSYSARWSAQIQERLVQLAAG